MLFCLPVELLSVITGLLPAHYIGRLWLCGTRLLQDRLGRAGGVKEIVLEAHPLHRAPLPRLLVHFAGLHRFHIQISDYDHMWEPISVEDFALLEKVPYISITPKHLVSAFLLHFTPNSSNFASHLVSLVLPASSFGDCLPSSSPLKALRCLARLELSIASLTLSDLPHDSLTHLHLAWKTLHVQKGDRFGACLKTLKVASRNMDGNVMDLVDLLPSGLETFTEAFGYHYVASDILALPRGLTTLRLCLDSWDEARLIALPPRLVNLYTTLIDINLAHLLPRSLQYCYQLQGVVDKTNVQKIPPHALHLGSMDLRFAHDIIDELPQTLNFISINSDSNNATSLISYPSQLETLYLPKRTSLMILSSLPSSLTDLVLFQDIEPQNLLPLRNLKSFSHYKFSKLSLPVNAYRLRNLAIKPRHELVIEADCSFTFPLLRSLQLTDCSIPPTFFGTLACGLETMIFEASTIPIGSVKLLPNSLTNLHLTLKAALPGTTEDVLITLPPNLRTFEYHDYQRSGGVVSDTSLQFLPPFLTCLYLRTCTHDELTENCTQHLPHSLERFTLGWNTCKWFIEWRTAGQSTFGNNLPSSSKTR